MDTRFWGKSGWELCHSIAYCYQPDSNSEYYKKFYKSLQHVLPCIFCRRSFKKFIELYQINIESKRSLTKWIYDIHNCVNDKLRNQGYPIEPNPSLKEVDKIYEKFTSSIKCMVGFDFIYSILFNYNLEVSETRKKGYILFFNSLCHVLPNEKIRTIYSDYLSTFPIEECFKKVIEKQSICPLKKWGHRLEKCMKKKCCSYKERCEKIEKHRVQKCTDQTCRIIN